MKRIDINKTLSSEVSRLISEGWYLIPSNYSFSGCDGVFFLSIDEGPWAGKVTALFLRENGGFGKPKTIELVCSVFDGEFDGDGEFRPGFSWRQPENCGVFATFYKIDANWYTDDAEYAEAAGKLRRMRLEDSFVPNHHVIEREVSDALLALIRKNRGWSRVKKANLRIVRSGRRFIVSQLNADGISVRELRFAL